MLSAELNPMMRQYWELKSRYPECLLFFRLGDFYEMFFEDAEKGSRLLGLTLTARDSGGESRAPMCGVPAHSVQAYIAKLLAAGEKVALCEQMEDPRKVKGLVKRDVVRVYTAGTLSEESLLQERANNYLGAVVEGAAETALATVDLSTGEFSVTGAEGPRQLDEIRSELIRLGPAEVLAPRLTAEALGVTELRWTFVDAAPAPADAREALLKHFGTASLAAFGVEDRPALQQAAAAALEYLGRTHRGGLAHLRTLATYALGSCMRLDPFTLDALEVVTPQRGAERSHTLLGVLDLTASAMGARTLRQWLLRPLIQAGEILDRLDAVDWLLEHAAERAAVRSLLGSMNDLERIAGRIGGCTATPKDLAAVRAAVGPLQEVRRRLAEAPGLLAERVAQVDELPGLADLLGKALVDEPPFLVTEGGIIRDGWHPEVDELRRLAASGKDVLLEIQARERKRTGIETLKVQYNSVFGYFLEVPKSKAGGVPADYVRKQTVANAERYITPELKEVEGKVLGASERLTALERDLFADLRDRAGESVPALLATARALGALDALAALAEAAARYGYVRPAIDPAGTIEILEGRHPVLERLQSTFVANDLRLVPWQEQVLLITGPNMAGKSTYLRQAALLTLMAHAGSFVPAKEARIGVVDGIYCRIGASDRLTRGQSTFMVEMTEVAHILNHATERSLLVFDEVGRGTSTYDGISIAWAIVEHVAKSVGAKTLFATHYYELTRLADAMPSVRNHNVLVREWKHELVFLYKIVPGRADRSYGVQVARLAGLPEPVVKRSRELLAELERGGPAERAPDAGGQLSLFEGAPDPVRQRLEEVEPEAMTPLDALRLVHDLKDLAGRGGTPPKFSDA